MIGGRRGAKLFKVEVAWSAFCLTQFFRKAALSTGDRRPLSIAARRVWLRRALRRTPWWARGHLLLGFSELGLLQYRAAAPDPRGLAAVRVCAQAAIELYQHELSPKRRDQAQYLLAMAAFLTKDYPGALFQFEEIISSKTLSETLLVSVFENAGAAAMVVEDYDRALAFFENIPRQRLTSQAIAAVSYLKSRTKLTPALSAKAHPLSETD